MLMVEQDTAALQALRANSEVLQATAVEVVGANALEFLKNHHDLYDVVFLDPPFADGHWPQLLAELPAILAQGGLVYCERAQALDALQGWEIVKSGRAGQVSHQLLKRT